jgi:uncharacterized protein involved in exopolysaccharide biosynthesis
MDDFNLNEIAEIIKKRKGFLILFILTVLLGTTLYTFMVTPVYEANARVLVNLEKPTPVNFENNFREKFQGEEFIETQEANQGSHKTTKTE